MPASLTASTGIDALVHAIEAYTALAAQPISDALALSAIELIGQNIRLAYANGRNAAARYNICEQQDKGIPAQCVDTPFTAFDGGIGQISTPLIKQ